MSKATVEQPLTTMVPVTTMEEMPLPSAAKRAAMIASLKKRRGGDCGGRGPRA
jgi:hypothetical protein